MRSNFSKLVITALAVAVIAGVVLYVFREKSIPEKVPENPEPTSTYKVIGSSVQGRKIESFTYGNGPKKVVFVGGIHGGYEWNSVLLAYRIKDYFEENPALIPDGLSITVIPDANPDGVFLVTGKEGRFEVTDVSTDSVVQASGRFNAHKVDLNRNFDCKWQPKSTWQSKTVDAGSAAFSEPEAMAIRDYMVENKPVAVIFWHSKSNAVYASQCEKGILPETLNLLETYAQASKYPAVKVFESYATTGAADDWLASVGIPAITVELSSHDEIEFARNWAGVKAVLKYVVEHQ